MTFESFAASTTGASHRNAGGPCEDAYQIARTESGEWTCAVVSDGCGSVPEARKGAELISSLVLEGLLRLAPALDERGPGEWLIDRSVVLLAEIRETLRRQLDGPLTDYSATIVAALISEAGGFILHFGDGVASAFALDAARKHRSVRLVSQSNPETGEYANQTFYVTEAGWIRHVRITPLPGADCVVLCTDGAQDLFYEGTRPHGPALVPLFKALAAGKKRAEKSLEKSLTTPEADKISGDDKTIVILARPEFLQAVAHLDHTAVIKGLQTEGPPPEGAPASHVTMSAALPDSGETPAAGFSRARHDPDDAAFLTIGQARRIGVFSLLGLLSLSLIAIIAWLVISLFDGTAGKNGTQTPAARPHGEQGARP